MKPGDEENLLTVFALAEASKTLQETPGRQQARVGSTKGLMVVLVSNPQRFRVMFYPTRELLQAGIRSKRLDVLEKDEKQGVEDSQEIQCRHISESTHKTHTQKACGSPWKAGSAS